MTALNDSLLSVPASLPVGNPLLDAVVQLTAQREQETLAQSLVNAISNLTDALSVTVYGLGGELGNLSAKVLASDNPDEAIGTHITSLESRPGLGASIKNQHVETLTTPLGLQIIHPVLEQDNVVGLLVREHTQGSDLHNDLVNGLVSIYANQQSLLNHQQRDGLTGLYNRVALQNWMNRALSTEAHADRREDNDTPTGCFAIFDIDYFKRINDSLGHLYGDEVLLIFADLMRESFRYNDLLFRYGGEEFVAILKDTDLETSLAVLERFRITIAQYNFPQINQVTVTIGVAQIDPKLLPTTLIDRADKALYYGKDHGRDQVNSYEWLKQGCIAKGVTEQPRNIELFSKN